MSAKSAKSAVHFTHPVKIQCAIGENKNKLHQAKPPSGGFFAFGALGGRMAGISAIFWSVYVLSRV